MSQLPDIPYYYIAAAILGFMVLAMSIILAHKLRRRYFLASQSYTWLELTPPANIHKTPAATDHLFSVLHGLRSSLSLRHRLLRHRPLLSCEIVSTKREGIRYLIRCDSKHASIVHKAITSYIPDSKVKEVNAPGRQHAVVLEAKQAKHFVLPITVNDQHEHHDPLAYIIGAMARLDDGEQLIYQLTLQPVVFRQAKTLAGRILHNEDILRNVNKSGLSFLNKFGEALNSILLGTTSLIGEVHHGTTYGHKTAQQNKAHTQLQAQVTKRQRPARTISAFELEVMESMHRKLSQPLFRVDMRLLISSPNKSSHIDALKSSLDAYGVPPYQELRTKLRVPFLDSYRERLALKRLPSLFDQSTMLLSASEVASLYHVPSSHISRTDNLATSLSRTLAAPISLKNGQDFSVILGENQHHSVITSVGLTSAERERHLYIIGGTGNGKTTLMQYAIIQDMQKGEGVAVVDPHGDMAETLLRYVPEERIKDVIYFNPDDIMHPPGLNLLELPRGLTDNELMREKDLVTEALISVFRKIFSEEDTGGHRIEYVLRNAIQTALTVEDATIFTIFKLINDPKYCAKVVSKLENEDLKNFWKNELGKAGDMQKVKMSAGITSKIGRFLFSASAKQVLEQPKSTIDFEEVINTKKILICNVSKGLLGEDTAELFGITILAKLQLASLRRARVAQADRRPYYLYVDEFQNFATTSFVQMLSESRKYKLFLTMAEQSTSQQKDQRMVNIILANVGTVLCFRTGNPADERNLLPLFSPYIQEGEIANQPPYHFYARLASTKSQEPMSGTTVLLPSKGSEKIAQKVIASSRKYYTKEISKPKPNKKPKVENQVKMAVSPENDE